MKAGLPPNRIGRRGGGETPTSQEKFHMSRQGSVAPIVDKAPEWVGMTAEQVVAKVQEMARDGMQPAKIGLVLRDAHGVPSVELVTGKKVGAIIAEANLAPSVPQELTNLINRAINLMDHLRTNRQDLHNRRGLEQIEARIRKLARYYKGEGMLAENWKYTRDQARLLVD